MANEHVTAFAVEADPDTFTVVLLAHRTGAWLDVAEAEAERMTWPRLGRILAHLLGESRRRARLRARRYGRAHRAPDRRT